MSAIPCFDCPVPPQVRYVPTLAELTRYAQQVAQWAKTVADLQKTFQGESI